jgi:chloride channel protein, CIC family
LGLLLVDARMITVSPPELSGLEVRSWHRLQDHAKLWLATGATGLVAGAGSVGFHYLADGDQLSVWCVSHNILARLPVVLAIPTAGLGLVGLVLQFFPESRLGGVKEVFEALENSNSLIPLRRMLNVILSGLVLAFGGSVGPEGPMIQMGAVVGSQFGKRMGVAQQHVDLMIRAGAAAGIAAAFRSPAGGVLLVLELFGARFNRGLVAVGVAAAIGYAVRTAMVGGDYPFRPQVSIAPLSRTACFLIVPLMGMLAAPTGRLFIWMFSQFRTLLPIQWPLAVRVATGAFGVGMIAIWFPQVLSSGYPVIQDSLRGGIGLKLFVVLLLLKMLATSITLGSGAVGGLFSPTLMIGAMYGGAFGYLFHWWMPSTVPQPELFVLLGMVVMFGSIARAHWSGLLMVADMTGCYHQLLLPGIIAGGISLLLSSEIHDRSIFGLPVDPARDFSGAYHNGS